MPRVKTSRVELIKLRKTRELVTRGVSILTSKRDALMLELRETAQDIHDIREKLDSQIMEASHSLMLARSTEPEHMLASAALVSQRKITFNMSMKNVWGVRVPSIQFPDTKRGPFERGSAPGRRSLSVEETASRFEVLINSLATSAVAEQRLLEIGGAIKSATRRVNALEGKVLPQLKKEMNLIQTRLEEMGREDTFRLKRFKKLKEKKDLS